MIYVAHDCRNTKLSDKHPDYCNNRWVDKDLTGATTRPPTWKYCEDCCKKLGIDFNKQKPSDYYTAERMEHYKKIHKQSKLKTNS